MTETMTVTFTCAPGWATPERALEIGTRVTELLQTITDDITPGAVTFAPTAMHWIADGKDEIVVTVSVGEPDE